MTGVSVFRKKQKHVSDYERSVSRLDTLRYSATGFDILPARRPERVVPGRPSLPFSRSRVISSAAELYRRELRAIPAST